MKIEKTDENISDNRNCETKVYIFFMRFYKIDQLKI